MTTKHSKDSKDRGICERKLNNGTIIYYIRLYHNGKPVVFGRFHSKSTARKIYAKAKVEQDEGRFDPAKYQVRGPAPKKLQGPLIFKDYAEQWLKEHTSAYKPSTFRGYRSILKGWFYPTIGNVPMAALTRQVIRAGILEEIERRTDDRENLTDRTKRSVYHVIKRVLKTAFRDELVSRNHAEDLDQFFRSPAKFLVIPLTEAEEKRFLEAVQRYAPEWYVLFFLLLRTGLRIGEALALQPSDIHFKERYISVVRNWTFGGIQTTKTDKGRCVDLARKLAEVLKNHITEQRLEAARHWEQPPIWLFPGQGKDPISQDHVRKNVFRMVLRKAGLRRFRIHDLRHTFATRLLLKGDRHGITLKYVSEQLGHASIATTADIYTHLIPQGNLQAIDALDEPHDRLQEGDTSGTATPADTEEAA